MVTYSIHAARKIRCNMINYYMHTILAAYTGSQSVLVYHNTINVINAWMAEWSKAADLIRCISSDAWVSNSYRVSVRAARVHQYYQYNNTHTYYAAMVCEAMAQLVARRIPDP